MSKLDQLHWLIEQSGKQLQKYYSITTGNAGNLLLICDNEAEYNVEDCYMFETTSIFEAYEFLVKGKCLESLVVGV